MSGFSRQETPNVLVESDKTLTINVHNPLDHLAFGLNGYSHVHKCSARFRRPENRPSTFQSPNRRLAQASGDDFKEQT
jgi:hypothetical protein